MNLYFNGRFLEQPLTGVQRYAIETILAFDAILSDPDFSLPVRPVLLTPPGVRSMGLKNISEVPVGRRGGHFWEQVSLRAAATDGYLVNFNYTAPVFVKKQLITLHDVTPLVYPSTFNWKFRLAFGFYTKALVNRVDELMTVSNFSKSEIRRCLGTQRDITVGFEGGEHARCDVVDVRPLLKSYDLEEGAYVLLVGSIKPNKNIGVVVDALRKLVDYPLKIVVAGAVDRRVFDVSENFGSVVYLGYVSDHDLNVLYKGAAWFLFPSLYEGFGLPALEAINNNCPLISSTAGSLPEICGPGALYFDPGSSSELAILLSRIVQEPLLRDQVKAEGKGRVELYNWHENAKILAKLLRKKVGVNKVN
jgi:glycosyltransferase involved in cell wall biosynthesis